jgi:hypothetical protein
MLLQSNFLLSHMPVPHACNPNYSGGRDQEDRSSKPAQENSSVRPYFEIPLEWFKCQYHKKKKKKKKFFPIQMPPATCSGPGRRMLGLEITLLICVFSAQTCNTRNAYLWTPKGARDGKETKI